MSDSFYHITELSELNVTEYRFGLFDWLFTNDFSLALENI